MVKSTHLKEVSVEGDDVIEVVGNAFFRMPEFVDQVLPRCTLD